jgi:hypothetical protein
VERNRARFASGALGGSTNTDVKSQTTNPKSQGISKSQYPNVQNGVHLGAFKDLGFELCLGFGAWDLGFTR